MPKNDNTFRFVSFHDRLKDIHVDVIRRRHRLSTNLGEDDDRSYFFEALEKWTDLDGTQHYDDFKHDIPGNADLCRHVQILHHQKAISESIRRHLAVENSLCLTALLELTVAFCCDLQRDFYENDHFWSFFDAILALVTPQSKKTSEDEKDGTAMVKTKIKDADPELLENVFSTMAHMLKLCRVSMCEQLPRVYERFRPLLNHRRSYLRRFSSESLSFLVRNASSRFEEFVTYCLDGGRGGEDESDQNHLAELLFESMRGTSKSFHSRAPQMLTTTLDLLESSNGDITRNAFELAESLHPMLAKYAVDEQMAKPLLADVLLKRTSSVVDRMQESSTEKDVVALLEKLVRLLRIWRTNCKGKTFFDLCLPTVVRDLLLVVLESKLVKEHDGEEQQEGFFAAFLDFAASIFGHRGVVDGYRREFEKFTKLIIDSSYDRLIPLELRSRFVTSLAESSSDGCGVAFELVCLPAFGEFVERIFADGEFGEHEGKLDDVLGAYCRILAIKRPRDYENIEEDDGGNIYDLFPGKKFVVFKRILAEKIASKASIKLASTIAVFGAIAVDKSDGRNVLEALLAKIIEKPTNFGPLVLYAATSTLINRGASSANLEAIVKIFPPKVWLDIFDVCDFGRGLVWMLRTADRYFAILGRIGLLKMVDESFFAKALEKMDSYFMHSSHLVRLVTGRLLGRIQRLADNEGPDDDVLPSIFDVSVDAESIFPLALDTYRNRLLHLRKLSFDEAAQYKPARYDALLRMVPLKVLIGQLHVNFALTWDPIVGLIETHIRGMGSADTRETAEEFWKFFAGDILQNASDNANSGAVSPAVGAKRDEDEDAFYDYWHPAHSAVIDDDRPDPWNFRHLLWRSVEKSSPECVEWKTKHLSHLILDLAEKELKLFTDDPSRVKLENLTAEGDEDEKEENDGKRKAMICIKTLTTMLGTYGRFRDIKSIAEEKALKNLYLRLLTHLRTDVQKAASVCIFAYKSKNLSPYKEYFDQLLDDSKFRDALTLFQIDDDGEEQCVVDPKHRPEVIKVLMRLLYGRMLGKAGSSNRKVPIFHFLAGCEEDELNEFLDLLLVPVATLLDAFEGSLVDHCQWIAENYDTTRSVCPRKLLGVFSTLHIVFRKLGHLFGDESKSRFWRLLAISSAVIEKFRSEKQGERIHRKYWRSVKELYRGVLTTLMDFFVCFGDDYNLHSTDAGRIEELKALFITTCSRTKLERFASGEGVNAASGGLLSLFGCWSQNPKLALFLTFGSDVGSKTSLESCVELLDHPACSLNVQNRILTILRDVSIISTTNLGDDKLPDGLVMLRPFVSRILAYMMRKLAPASGVGEDRSMDKKRRSKAEGGTLSELDLQLLSKLTACVTEPEASESMVTLLLPGLGTKRVKSEAAEADTLVSLCRLIKNVVNCAKYHEPISRLFSRIKARTSRRLLCDLWCAAFVDDRKPIGMENAVEWEMLEFMAKVIRDWESWDEKRIEEPDFGRRTSAYHQIKRRLDTGELQSNVDFVRLVLHECAFVVLETEDLSLRDNAAYTLRKLIESMATTSEMENVKRLVNSDLLPILKRGFKSQQETVRLEFVAVLASASRSFPQHPRFVGLDSLTPQGAETESDFFENLRHIQLHLRGRALRRLSEKLEQQDKNVDPTAKKISSETVYLYFLPVCLPWPYVDAVAKHQSALIEEVVRLLTAYCKYQAHWKRYESLLKYFLNRLQKDAEKQKMTVKLLTGLLDGFRYDLSKVKVEMSGRFVVPVAPIARVDEDAAMDDRDEQDAAANDDDDKLKTKIFAALTKYYLTRLQKALNRPLQTEVVHRTNQKSHYDEDEHILRIPIALALVKLLKKLPVAVLESNLPGILYKVCHMLKSRSFTVRELTRKTLSSIAVELGPRYLPFIIREMRAILTRGYQIHVLIFTVHALLNALAHVLVAGDLDACMDDILEICNEDLFGAVSEEKEVDELTKNLKEARAQKTYVTYGVLGRLSGVGCLDRALRPLKTTLETKHTLKTVSRVSTALHHFAVGLSQNAALGEEMSFVFIHRTLTDCLPMLSATFERKKNPELEELEKEAEAIRLQSCFILPPEPGRTGVTTATPKSSKRNNIHVLVEFALDVLFLTMKKAGNAEGRDKDETITRRRMGMLDPLIDHLYECTTTVYTKTVASGLRCLCYLAKWYSDGLKTFGDGVAIKKFLDRLFVLLNQYGGLGRAGSASSGSEFAASAEVLAMSFKLTATLIQNVEECRLNSDQLRLLLHYVDEDLTDRHRQAAAFTLIKAILTRKYQCEKDPGGSDLLTTVMQRLRDMSITSQSDHIRAQCRQLVIKHAIGYGLLKGKKPRQLLEYYCAQLSYEFEDGRISALESLSSLIDCVDQKSLNTYSSMIYVFLAMRLIKDESSKCKKMVAVTLKHLFRKVDAGELNSLVAMALGWLRDEKIRHKLLGTQLLSLFIEADGSKFQNRLPTVLPVLTAEFSQLRAQNYAISVNEGAVQTGQEEMATDQLLFLLLTAVRKIFDQCPSVLRNDPAQTERMNEIWDNVKELLHYPHQSVQLVASQLFGMLFASYTPQELAPKSSGVVRSHEYLMKTTETRSNDDDDSDPGESIWRELCDTFIASLRLPDCQADLAEQAIKNLVFVARVIANENGKSNKNNDQNGQDETIDLAWLTRRLVRLCRMETSKTPRNYLKRSCVFKWIAAMATHVDKEQLSEWLPLVLAPLYRELTVHQDSDSEIKELTSQVCDLLKRTVGVDEYSQHWVVCQRSATEKRFERKRKIADEAIINPEASARRKIRKQKKKVESKKRKWASLSGGIKKPKRARTDNEKEVGGLSVDD